MTSPLSSPLNPLFETTKIKDREALTRRINIKGKSGGVGVTTPGKHLLCWLKSVREKKSVTTETQEHNVPLQEERWWTFKVFKHSKPSENLKTPYISTMKKTNNAFTVSFTLTGFSDEIQNIWNSSFRRESFYTTTLLLMERLSFLIDIRVLYHRMVTPKVRIYTY